MARPLNRYRVLREEYIRLHGPLPDDGIDWESLSDDEEGRREEARRVDELLPRLYDRIHALGSRSALCFSGGGIRSATFSLGVIQRLAKVGVLPQFDYLSTVSGGGYIGSWLSSFVRRNENAAAGVTKELGDGPSNPFVPEPEPVHHLREFSNYLTPKLGLFSGDTWAMAGTYLRNVLLNWLMLIPLIAAVLAIPRLVVAILHHNEHSVTVVAIVTAAALAIALMYLALTRPVRNKTEERWLYTNGGFLTMVVVPFVVAAIGVVLLWGWRSERQHDWLLIGGGLTALSTFASLVYIARYAFANRTEPRDDLKKHASVTGYTIAKAIQELLAAAVAGATAAALLWVLSKLFAKPTLAVVMPKIESWKDWPADLVSGNAAAYVCFAVPCVLLVFFIQSALFVGLASWYNEEYDREWWSRAAGWVLVAAVCWIGFTAITIYGPVFIYSLPTLFTALGLSTGAVSVLGGKSGHTSGSAEQKDDDSTKSTLTNIGLAIVAPLFVLCILSLISLATSRVSLSLLEAPIIPSEQVEFYSAGTYQLKATEPLAQGQRSFDRIGAGERVFETKSYPALDPAKLHALEHLWAIDHSSAFKVAIAIAAAVLLAWLASLFVGVNRFSMHAFYRNRLIRAYLGASRWRRTPNPFTGFDPKDNLPLHKLRPEMFWVYSFRDLAGFGAILTKDPDPLVAYLREQLTPALLRKLSDHPPDDDYECRDLLADNFNRILDEHDLEQRKPARDVSRSLMSLRNRELLDRTFPNHLQPLGDGRPLHVVNMALNLVSTSSDRLAWQQRKAESFTASPLYCGNYQLGYRSSRVYGGPSGISLGTAVAISGAAASPNMGYHSSPALSFLLTLFNVRLGWWLGNPGPAGETTHELRNPRTSLGPLIAELFGMTNDRYKYVYLSDGGHFENLGIYEMVLRRCRSIVVVDAGADQNFIFDDLGNAIRKIRIDFGITIDVTPLHIFPRSMTEPKDVPQYFALGRINYADVDGPGTPPGTLIYIKPAFYEAEVPRDVYNYGRTSQDFPHESTGDQWFSESQFESYRRLGEFAIERILGDGPIGSINELVARAASRMPAGTAEPA
ncbi:MAG TPA: patatin-like phospholipase family protein [Thermoanaerobaculia bacterium]